jgi:hypothetical protein
MKDEGIFINGVFETVVDEILAVQAHLPEQVLYLQPYKGQRIVRLAENSPSVENPVQLFLSLTDDLPRVHYTCEIVGWDDKRQLVGQKRNIIEKVINTFQPNEGGVYMQRADDTECVNLLHVWRMKQLSKPFSVAEFLNVKDGLPISTNRSTSGGWVYLAAIDLGL